jgi:hypothetical protein
LTLRTAYRLLFFPGSPPVELIVHRQQRRDHPNLHDRGWLAELKQLLGRAGRGQRCMTRPTTPVQPG